MKVQNVSEPLNMHSVLEAAASNPKVGAAVAAATGATGAANYLQVIDGFLARASMVVALATAIVVFGVQLIRFEQAWRERRQKNKESA